MDIILTAVGITIMAAISMASAEVWIFGRKTEAPVQLGLTLEIPATPAQNDR